MKKSLIVVLILNAFVPAALAAETCKRAPALADGLADIDSVAGALDTTKVKLGDIVRNEDGSVRTMNQIDAEKYCKAQGGRLPTVRELAEHSQSLGARGISETAQSGYYPVYTKNSKGEKVVDFYFDDSGYKRPSGDEGNNWFWSSSVHPDYSDYAYNLGGDYGYLGYDPRSLYNFNAVRCVR